MPKNGMKITIKKHTMEILANRTNVCYGVLTAVTTWEIVGKLTMTAMTNMKNYAIPKN